MTLKEIREWLKPQISDINKAYIGKTDPSQEKSICVYGRVGPKTKVAVGGLTQTHSAVKAISILVQWSKNCDVSEQKAQSIYSIFNGKKAVINGVNAFFSIKNGDEPVPVGTNDNDIYEFVIDINILYQRKGE